MTKRTISQALVERFARERTIKNRQLIEELQTKFKHFDFSKVDVSSNRKATIVCTKHNTTFTKHLNAIRIDDCPACKLENDTNNNAALLDELKAVHKKLERDTNFDKTVIESKSKPFIVTCNKHGDYTKQFGKHLTQGCNQCRIEENKIRKNILMFDKINELHQNTLDFSLIDMSKVHKRSKVDVRCTIHDEIFSTTVHKLQQKKYVGQLCKSCEIDSVKIELKKSLEERELDYTFDDFEFVDKSTPFDLTCPKHGAFSKRHNKHFVQSCPECKSSEYKSKQEQEVFDFVQTLVDETVVSSSRKLVGNNVELDIYVPSKRVAIEYNGLYWHSSEYRQQNYHLNKTNRCEDNDIQLIHLFEDEWLYKKEIVKSRLRNIIAPESITRIYGRNTEIRSVDASTASDFLNNNHIQGACSAKHKYGLYYNDELVSLMTFSNYRIVTGLKSIDKNNYELIRFCNKINTSVIGGASKLLKHFIKLNQPDEIMSYACRRWSVGNLYKQLGFTYVHSSGPSYAYHVNGKRLHRSKFQKHKLVEAGFDAAKTEQQIMSERGFYRVYDCGTTKWLLKVC